MTIKPKDYELQPIDVDDVRDLAIHVVEHLLDKSPGLLNPLTLEVDGEFSDDTWRLQDEIMYALLQVLINETYVSKS